MPWVPRLLTVVPVMTLNSSLSQLQLFQVQYQSNFWWVEDCIYFLAFLQVKQTQNIYTIIISSIKTEDSDIGVKPD